MGGGQEHAGIFTKTVRTGTSVKVRVPQVTEYHILKIAELDDG